MSTEVPAAINAAKSSIERSSTLSAELLSRIFADSRRRILLRKLQSCDEPVELDQVAVWVAAEEFDTTPESIVGERFERVLVSLYHSHLPILSEAGLVEADHRDGVVVEANTDAISQLL